MKKNNTPKPFSPADIKRAIQKAVRQALQKDRKKRKQKRRGKKTVKQDKKKKSQKTKFRVRNWPEYNESLKRRGSLDFWVEQGIIDSWKVTVVKDGTLSRGRQRTYTDHAIETVLMLGKVFHQLLRQAEAFCMSVFNLAGILIDIPNYTTVSRRGKVIKVTLSLQAKDTVAAIIDSTGLKVYGEGEWKVREHGISKRRTWVKMHISVDVDGEIRVVLATDPSVADAEAGITLLTAETQPITKTANDGAYDKEKFYQACIERGITDIVIPPREDAKIWIHGNSHHQPHPRDENLRAIRKTSKTQWKKDSGYHIRSGVENTMFRRKTILGSTLSARLPETQATEITIGCKILNLMRTIGMPDSYPVPPAGM